MKKIILILQILILTSQSAWAADTGLVPIQTTAEIAPSITLPMPKNYKLPDMQLLDSVAFYNQYKDQLGKRVTVHGYTGRFGATFGDEFKQKIFEIESQSHEQVEIILSLTSTLEDAKILKQRMALVGRKMVIVEIPDEVQNQILEKAAAQAAGGLKELWWDTKHKTNQILHPIKTASDTVKIIKNQFVKPNRNDMSIVAVSVLTTVATTALLLFMPGVDPSLAITMGISRILIGGTALTFRRTVSNVYRANIFEDVAVVPTSRQVLLRTLTMGLGLGEIYYGIGSSLHSPAYGMNQEQIFANTLSSGVIDTAASIERDRRLSQIANYRMFIYSLIIGSAISTIGVAGYVGPMILDQGFIQISALQTFSLVLYSGMLLSYKYFSDNVEKIAQKDLKLYLIERYRKFVTFRALKQKRQIEEQNKVIANKKRLAEMIDDMKTYRAQSRAAFNPTCSRLFY